VVLAIILGAYLLLRTVPEPPVDSLLTSNTRGFFVLNLDPDQPHLSSLLWRVVKNARFSDDRVLTRSDFDKLCQAYRFFIYPKVYITLQETEMPFIMAWSVIVNFRRSNILFRYLAKSPLQKSGIPDPGEIKGSFLHAFHRNSWILSDDLSSLNALTNRLKGVSSDSIPAEWLTFWTPISNIKSPEHIITGYLDKSGK
jgi:hypothetical protein